MQNPDCMTKMTQEGQSELSIGLWQMRVVPEVQGVTDPFENSKKKVKDMCSSFNVKIKL